MYEIVNFINLDLSVLEMQVMSEQGQCNSSVIACQEKRSTRSVSGEQTYHRDAPDVSRLRDEHV